MKHATFMLLLALPTQAQQANLSDLRQEIRIIANMLETAFESNRGSWHDDIDVDGTYLREQGIVLRIESGGFSPMHFDFPHFEIAVPEIAVSLPFAPEDMEDSWEAYEDAMEELQDVYIEFDEISRDQGTSKEIRDKMRALREEQRKLSNEQRRKTDELRRKLERSREMSDDERQAISDQIQKSKSELKDISKKYAEELDELREKQRQEWQSKQTDFEHKIVDILCNYGSALRALPDNEHLTIIFDNGSLSDEGETQDRIYVFDKSDLLACREGKMDKATLLNRGQSYGF
ncbi:MAG: hypothetical protein KDC35_21100 [Acidobacteria bacterium]|nr:hypothetical protein [Acidobacteriota bacterium]